MRIPADTHFTFTETVVKILSILMIRRLIMSKSLKFITVNAPTMPPTKTPVISEIRTNTFPPHFTTIAPAAIVTAHTIRRILNITHIAESISICSPITASSIFHTIPMTRQITALSSASMTAIWRTALFLVTFMESITDR